ncbi:hypothetical protein ABPG72_007163 [Tetrahymena utriculariae]
MSFQQAQQTTSSSINSKETSSDSTPIKSTNVSIWKEAQLSYRNKEIPSARWGHSFVKANDDLLYLFGGYAESNYMNDQWIFDLNSFQWIALPNYGTIPEKRSNHSGCYLEQKNKILIFGGGGKEKKRFNDVHLYDIDNCNWEYLKVQNSDLITPRTYHSANLFFDKYLVVFGGEGVGDLNDLCVLSLEQEPLWILLQPLGKEPPKRRFHSSAIVQNKLYILGGCFSNYRCHDDIWELNIGEYLQDPNNIQLGWRQITHYNHVFQPRWGQCSQVYDDKIYIFGGRNLKDLNETIIFDPSKQADCLVKIDQTSPNPRRRGAAVVVGSTIIVFGGFDGVYYNDIHYLNISQTENEHNVKMDTESHFKYLQNIMYSQQGYDLEIQLSSFKVGIHKVIVLERMNDPKNKAFLNRIEMVEILNLSHKDFEQRFFLNTVVQYLYSGVFDYRQIRNQRDLNLLQEFAHEINLNTLLEALNQNEQWIRQEIQSTLVQRFNSYYFQRYFRSKQHYKKFLSFANSDKKLKSEHNLESKDKSINTHQSIKNYDPTFVIVNDSIWFEDNEIFYQYSDITLQCECKQIRANKLLLTSQSQYFKTLFEQAFIEKSESIIYIEIVSYSTLKILMNFFYYHKIILPSCFEISDWLNLIEASKYFQIPQIQEICEVELIKMINIDNLFNLYYSSILFNCPKLRKNCSYQYAQKLYSQSIFMEQNPNDQEDDILIQMGVEAQYIYKLLRFQISQDKVIEQNVINEAEKIEIEYDNHGNLKNVQEFLSNNISWERQVDIINRLKRCNTKQKNLGHYFNNNMISNSTQASTAYQNCYCSNNCEQTFSQNFDQNTSVHIYESGYNSCKQMNNYHSAEIEKFNQKTQYSSKCLSQLFQPQDYNVFSKNNYSNKIQKLQNNQKTCKNTKFRHSPNSKNEQSSLCLSGRSQDSTQYGAIQDGNKTNSENCKSNADSEEYDIQNNAMIEETQSFIQIQASMEYSL